MGEPNLWLIIKRHAHQLFPALAVGLSAVILSCPFYSWPFSWLATNSFARFCMFWALAVFIVLAFSNRRFRPAAVSIVSVAISLIVGALFTVISVNVAAAHDAVPEIALACLSGAILGALAGTWLIYVLEVYSSK